MRDRRQSVQFLCVILIVGASSRLISTALGHGHRVALPIACWSLFVGVWGVIAMRDRTYVPRATARRRCGSRE